VGIGGEHDRVARVDDHLQERLARIELPDRLAEPGGGELDGDAGLGDRAHGDVVVVAQVALRPGALGAPVLHEVRMGEHVEEPTRRGLREPREVRPPDLVGGVRAGPHVVLVVVQAALAEEVDRAEHVVPRMRLQERGHAVLAPGDEIGLDAEAQIGLLLDPAGVGGEVVAGGVAPQLVIPDPERVGEAVHVLRDAELRDALRLGGLPVALRVAGGEELLGGRVGGVRAQMDVVVGQHGRRILPGRSPRGALGRGCGSPGPGTSTETRIWAATRGPRGRAG